MDTFLKKSIAYCYNQQQEMNKLKTPFQQQPRVKWLHEAAASNKNILFF